MATISRRRTVVAALALLGLLGLAGPLGSAKAAAAFTLTRVAGADRYETAADIAADAFAAGATHAIVARGDNFADALAGAYLGGVVGGGAPVLLTQTSTLPEPTKKQLAALEITDVHVLGGTAAVSNAVGEELGKDYKMTRLAGANRYETAAKIAQAEVQGSIGLLDGERTAIIASGEAFPDALAAGPVAFAKRFPIVLTRPGALPNESKTALNALDIEHAIVVGGTAAVGSAVASELTTMGITVERVAGATRYATATALADFNIKELSGWSSTGADLATGERFADALTGGPSAGRASRSILLTNTAGLSPATKTWLEAHSGTLVGGRVFGGTSAVSGAVVTAAETAARDTTTRSGQVTLVDAANDRYTFVAEGADTPTTVSYRSGETLVVDGASAQAAGFETALTAGDKVKYTPPSGTTPAKHEITNVVPASITSGMVGNVDIANHQFDIINKVTGDILRADITIADAAAHSVDGVSGQTRAALEEDISEGDTAVVSGTNVALTNASVSGTALNIEKPNAVTQQLSPATRLNIDRLGDNPASGNTQVQTTNDDKYVANGGDSTTDLFRIGSATSTYAEFNTALSIGDTVTYEREGGVETFTLKNEPPPTFTGQASGAVTVNGDGAPGNDTNDGGNFVLATDSQSVTVTYTGSTDAAPAVFVVDGVTANEATFEANYSPGDLISFRPGDTGSSTTQRLELSNDALAGAVSGATVNTDNAPAPPAFIAANSYPVIANNGLTLLARVAYADSEEGDKYVVNGEVATLEAFETALGTVKSGQRSATVYVERRGSGDTAVEVHRLTTRA